MPLYPGILLALVLAAGPQGRPARAATSSTSGPSVATEDTMFTELPPLLVTAPRVTIEEILGRVARGERRRDSLMTDQSFLLTVRMVRNADREKPAQLVTELVTRVWKKKPDKVRSQLLRRVVPHPEKKGGARVSLRGSAGMDEEVVDFAFRPEAHRQYRYRIAGRDIVGDHLIYRIAFEPRSLLDPATPRGVVWIDTNDFVIVRQEVIFDRSPAAPILKGIDRMVIERQNVDGYWVLARVLLRAQAAIPLPQIGRSFDFALRFDEYAINTGLPDSLFTGHAEDRE